MFPSHYIFLEKLKVVLVYRNIEIIIEKIWVPIDLWSGPRWLGALYPLSLESTFFPAVGIVFKDAALRVLLRLSE